VSSNLVYLLPTKQFALPTAKIETSLSKVGDSYRLRVSSKVLARSVYVSSSLDAHVYDNYFDLLPGEPVEIDVNAAASLEELQAKLHVVSLRDAFPSS